MPATASLLPKFLTIVVSALLAAGCATPPPANVGAVSQVTSAALGQSGYTSDKPTVYRLRASDVIAVNVFREPDLSTRELPVATDGTVALPLVGVVQARGLTTSEMAEAVTIKLRDAGIRDPQVSINVTDPASHQVVVEGGVTKPGVYAFSPGARLSSAIALAEGPTRVAKLDEVAIFRESDTGIQVAKFDYFAVSQGTMIDPVLQPGDRVVVGLSGLSQTWQDALRAIPVFALFTNI